MRRPFFFEYFGRWQGKCNDVIGITTVRMNIIYNLAVRIMKLRGVEKMEVIDTRSRLAEAPKFVQKVAEIHNVTATTLQLRAGTVYPEHHASVDALIVVRTGIVKFTVEGKEVLLTSDNLLHMKPFEKHKLEALEDVEIIVLKIAE